MSNYVLRKEIWSKDYIDLVQAIQSYQDMIKISVLLLMAS